MLATVATASAVVALTTAGPAGAATGTPAGSTAAGGSGGAATGAACPWVHSKAPIPTRVAQVLAHMTLDQKIGMVHGASGSPYVGNIPAIPSLCVPAMNLEDGPAGVADGMTGVTQLPAPVALSSTWNPALAKRYGGVIGTEEKGKGANVDLGPTINIVRDPRWGRAFESMSEDPYLTARMGTADIEGIQRPGLMAQVKHFAVYNQETYRNTPQDDAIVGQRALNEIYLPAFQAAVQQGHASSVMCSYSRVNGPFACQDQALLQDILKDKWGFKGFVTSDWGATHSTVASANHGLDMQMPDDSYFGAALKKAVQQGKVPVSRINDMVSRILYEEFRFGLFDNPPTGSPDAVVTGKQHSQVATDVAEQGMVLLKNSGGVLPLDSAKLHSIAVIGDDAGKDVMSAGGGSASVVAPYVITPYDGIKQRAGASVTTAYAQGYPSLNQTYPAIPSSALTPASGSGHGLTGAYYSNQDLSGSPTLTRVDPQVDFNWGNGSPAPSIPVDHFSARWTGTLTPPTTGSYTLALTSDDGSRLFVNGKEVIDNWRDQAPTTETTTMNLTAGHPVQITMEYYENGGGAVAQLEWQPPGGPNLLQQAVKLAKQSDVAVVFAGKEETEGSDLTDISLGTDQNQVISAVAKANPNTIVVLTTGSAVEMPWVNKVAGVVEAWYPGQNAGTAIASVLFGDTNPSGRLPVTFPKTLSQVPASTQARWPGVNGKAHYSEGLLVGYRWYGAKNIQPLFPFGYGLSYTTFRFDDLHATVTKSGTVRASVKVTNTGSVAGTAVPEFYVHQPAATGEPPQQLKGFDSVRLAPGASTTVTVTLDRTALQHYEVGAGWVTTPGSYTIGVGSSSADITATQRVTVS